MCVKILKLNQELSYDMNKPLEEQIDGYEKIVVNYQQNDPEIEHFVDEVERICQNGINCNLNITVKTNNILKGAKVKRHLKSLDMQLQLNDFIKLISLAQRETDKKLEELSEMMKK